MIINFPSRLIAWAKVQAFPLIVLASVVLSIVATWEYSRTGLNLAYNDARSHLDIGRRVVEGLKPGLAQIGSVWLPLPHLLMVPTVWNDFFWHSGLSGSLQSMFAYVATVALVYKFLESLKVGLLGRLVAAAIFATNPNILYLQSTSMTELLLLFTMTAGCYFLVVWHKSDRILDLIKAGFFIMLSTLVRYDGWFLLVFACGLIFIHKLFKKGWSEAEGTSVLFGTLAGFGIFLWLGWNLLIFKDPLYFAFGPYSAHHQQAQLESYGILKSKGDIVNSFRVYMYALIGNSTTFFVAIGLLGLIALLFDRRLPGQVRLATTTLLAPLAFNIIALFLGHSVIFVPEINNNSWFNIRYGAMMIPSIAVFSGFLVDRAKNFRAPLIGCMLFVMALATIGKDTVTIDDGVYGVSQENVSGIANFLRETVGDKPGFILTSMASHDSIVFSSYLPMKRFIHEGTGAYWEAAIAAPDRWARWIMMRTGDTLNSGWRELSDSPALSKYNLIKSYNVADIYELKPEYVDQLITKPVFTNQK